MVRGKGWGANGERDLVKKHKMIKHIVDMYTIGGGYKMQVTYHYTQPLSEDPYI
jgi:hypothetical protein